MRNHRAETFASRLAKAKAWLTQGFVEYRKHFGGAEFLRNNFNSASIGGVISVLDQIWINGKMTLPEIIRSRIIATVVDLAGAGDATVSGHSEWLKLFNITPETPDWKRRAVEWPIMVAGVAGWNSAQYFLGRVAASHYLRSVCISTVIGVFVQVGVLRVSAVLNNFATDDPKYCRNMPGCWSKACGCEALSPGTKRRLYWCAIVCFNAFMFANWMWGEKLRHALLGN